MIAWLQKKYALSQQRERLGQGVFCLPAPKPVLHGAGGAAVPLCSGPDGRRCHGGGRVAFYLAGLPGVPGPDLPDHLVPIQRHLLCHVCGERGAPG